MPAPLRSLRRLGLTTLAGAAALGLAACGAGPRESDTTTIDGLILDRGVVVGASGDRTGGVRGLNASQPKRMEQLESSMRSPLFDDGGETVLTPYLNGLKTNPIPADEEKAKHTYPGDIAYAGDRAGWVVRDVDDVAAVPQAVVGLFPAPFSTRFTKKRRLLPARVQCAEVESAACEGVEQVFAKLKLNTATSNLQDTAGIDVVRIYVGSWPQLRPALSRGRLGAALTVEDLAERNGYGFQISPDGKSIRAAAAFGEAAEAGTFGAGTGVIYAIPDSVGAPVWIISGADAAGTANAASALNESTLAGRVAAIVPPK